MSKKLHWLSIVLIVNIGLILVILKILDYNIDYDKRKFLESFYINNTKNSKNDKDRNVFPKIYSNIKNLNECGFSTS